MHKNFDYYIHLEICLIQFDQSFMPKVKQIFEKDLTQSNLENETLRIYSLYELQ